MRYSLRLTWLTVLLVIAACRPAVDVEAEKRAIDAHWQELNAALESHDWPRYQSLWAHVPYVEIIHPAEPDWRTGWRQFEARYRPLLESNIDFGSAETRRMHTHIGPSGDVAWATIEVTAKVGEVEETSWLVVVYQKIDGRWRVVLALDSPVGSATSAN